MKQVIKQPSENLDYDFDFSGGLPGGDSIGSAVVTVSPSGLTLGTRQILEVQTVKQWISGGTAGITYKITCVATSVAGRIKELEFMLCIIDR